MEKKKYKLGEDVYELNESEAKEFLVDFPDAELINDINRYQVGGNQYDLTEDESEEFLVDFPDAELIGKDYFKKCSIRIW